LEKITKSELEFYNLAKELNHSYKNEIPFPHCVIDNLINPELLKEISNEFQINKKNLQRFNNPNEKKLASADWDNFGKKTIKLIEHLNGPNFIKFLELLTGIDGLVSDNYLEGGGLHQIDRGGYLKIHADFNKHSITNLDRRLNVLLFLNEKWLSEWGGDFEIWSKDAKRCEKKISPIFNRMVIFSTTDYSYHGHPDPLNCPNEISRKSIALYYYTSGRPSYELRSGFKYHSTLFIKRKNKHQDSMMSFYNFIKKLHPKQILKTILPGPFIDWFVSNRRKNNDF
tara:strand:- start:300 stop:1151 length:852 start_codon:yes stop_codon:yes gene_type:complete